MSSNSRINVRSSSRSHNNKQTVVKNTTLRNVTVNDHNLLQQSFDWWCVDVVAEENDLSSNFRCFTTSAATGHIMYHVNHRGTFATGLFFSCLSREDIRVEEVDGNRCVVPSSRESYKEGGVSLHLRALCSSSLGAAYQ
jgi:hypothetical protein